MLLPLLFAARRLVAGRLDWENDELIRAAEKKRQTKSVPGVGFSLDLAVFSFSPSASYFSSL